MKRTILDEVKTKIDLAEVISFDIFDTLILRNYTKPTDLFRHIGESLSISKFEQKRKEAERKARRLNREKGIDEVSLEQIYANLHGKYKKCQEYEISLEKVACHANPEMKVVFDYCLAQKKRIVITSDMYLPLDVITEIINNAGYSGYEKIFLSSETLHQKATQKLYFDVISYTKTSPDQILHIGDNSFGDMQMATASGLLTYLYTPTWKRELTNINKNYFEVLEKYNKDSIIPSMLEGLIILHEANNPDEPYWENFGYKYTGIIALGYMRWLKEQLDKHGIKKAYFMLRDGYIFKQVFDKLYPDFETHEIYGSRTLFMLAGMQSYEDIRLHITGIHRLELTYRRIWERLNIKDDELYSSFEKMFPELDSQLSTDEDFEKVDAFFEENIDKLKEAGKKQRKSLIDYFESIGLFDGRCAIVDLGWKASMLKGILGICNLENRKTDLYGYYLGTHEFDDTRCKTFGYAIYKNIPSVYPYKLLYSSSYICGLLELMFSAPHASILGLLEEKGAFSPVYQIVIPEEKKRIDAVGDIARGAVSFALDFIKSEGTFGIIIDKASSIASLDYFENCVSKHDERQIARICYFPGVGGDTKCFPISRPNSAGFYFMEQKNFGNENKAIALVTPWAGDISAEREVMLRIEAACNDIGRKCLFVDSYGWILDENTQQRTNVLINPQNLLFAIELHYESHKAIDTFFYHVVWNPPEIPMNLPYYTDYVTNNYMMNDDFLAYDNGGMRNHLKAILQNCPRDIDSVSELVASFPKSVMLEPKLDKPLLFYCGMNWECVVAGALSGSRHQGLFRLLDNCGKVKFFGPNLIKAWGNKRPWAGYKCYQHEIPFDGFSILKEINECGICLVLSSDIHRRAGAVTNRAYEACAAGAVMISDDNEFMLEHFKDAALFITYNKKNPQDTFNQIMEKYWWIVSHKGEALSLARRAQEIFRERFALDVQLKKVIENHPKRVETVHNALFAKDTSKTVLVTYIVDTLSFEVAEDRLERIIGNIKNQFYKNIVFGIACDVSIADELKCYCEKNYKDTILLPLQLYDKKGSRCITRGIATRKLHEQISHNYFVLASSWETWFSDHITTLIRAIENTGARAAYSGSLAQGVDGFKRTCNFGVYTQNDLYQMTKWDIHQKSAEWLFTAEADAFVPEFVLENIDGLEHLVYANFVTAKAKKEITFSRRMTYSISEIDVDNLNKVVPNEMQVRLIQDAVRFDVADKIQVWVTPSTHVTKQEIWNDMQDFPIKQFVKTRLKRKFPFSAKVYKLAKKIAKKILRRGK